LYFRYYHASRTHLGVAKQCPLAREISRTEGSSKSRRSVVSITVTSGSQPNAMSPDVVMANDSLPEPPAGELYHR